MGDAPPSETKLPSLEPTDVPRSERSRPAHEGPPIPCFSFDRRDLVPIGVISVVIVGMFWRMVFTSDMPFFRDIFNFSYPLARFIHSMVRQGQLPYWNPYYNWGQHVLSDPNALFFYPSTLVLVLLPVNFAFSMHFVVHFAWAGAGAYVLARRWGQRRDAALVAALFFALSGPLRSLGISLPEATYWSLHPLQLLEFVVPDFFGSPFPPLSKWKEALNGVNLPYLVSLYVGFIPAFLASVAWCAGRNRRARFALGAFAVLMLVAFGRFTPFFAFLFKVFPVVRLVRYPVKLVVPSAMLVAISAGWGFETLRQPPGDWPARSKSLTWALAAL